MELTDTQFRALTKARNLLKVLEGRMTKDEHCLFNEVVCDWADIKFYETSDGNRSDVRMGGRI